jgi:predicted secreted protein
MNRSKKCVFVSHCLLAQAVVAQGLAKISPAAVRPVIQFCLDNDINIFQMPCPEVLCAAGGLGRSLHGKRWYEKHGLRETSSRIAKEQVSYMAELIRAGFDVLAVIGVEFSPACAPNYLNEGKVIIKDEGIYVEELKRELMIQGIQLPFVGVNQRWTKKLERQLSEILEECQKIGAK